MVRTSTRTNVLPLPNGVRKRYQFQQRIRGIGRRFLLSIDLSFTLVLLLLVGLYVHVWQQTLPIQWFQKSTLSLVMLDRDGKYLYEKPAENGKFGAWLPRNHIPHKVKMMTIAAEDHRIQDHPGVDPFAIGRAFWGNVKAGRRTSGASTLAMQLVKQLRPSPRTYANKLNEMYWALVLQHHLGTDGILKSYLNRAPYGNRVQGIHRASLLYFDRPTADLSYAQAAFLAALPWAPGRLNPFHEKGKALAWKRAKRILRRAKRLGWLSQEDYKESLQESLRIQSRPFRVRNTLHFTEKIKRAWKVPKGLPLEKRLTTLRTTLDLELQKKASEILSKEMEKLRLSGAGTASLVVMDHRSGEILTYIGSENYFDTPSRGALDYANIPHSTGSTLKPFIYGLGIEQVGMTGASLLSDLATSYLWKRGAFHPRNYDYRYFGPLRMRVALGNSRNIPALRALASVGVSNALHRLRRLGMASLQQEADYYGLGLSLGTGEVTLLEMVRAYGILARSGKPLQVKWLKSARDSLGRKQSPQHFLPQLFARHLEPNQIMNKDAARLITKILSDPMARLPSFKRYGSLEFTFPVAAKTGTSQGFRNAWLVGFSDRVVIGCWVGNHDRKKMQKLSGTRACGRIFKKLMKAAMKRVDPLRPPSDFPNPKGWVKKDICPLSGHPVGPACPRRVEEWLPKHQEYKTEPCPFHKRLALDQRNQLLAGKSCPAEYKVKQSFVILPLEYAMWGNALGLPQPPRHYSPLCPEKAVPKRKQVFLRIKEPTNKAQFIFDPTIPSEFSTLALKAESTPAVKKIVWYANGRKLGQKEWPYTFRWSLKRGTHQIVASTEDGRFRSRPVTIHIR